MGRSRPGVRRSRLLAAVLALAAAGCAETPPSAPAPAPEPEPVETGDLVPDTRPGPVTNWTDATIPQGSPVRLVLAQRLASDQARPGAVFEARLPQPLLAGPLVALPAGSMFKGFVGPVTPADAGADQGGSIELRFRVVHTPVGTGATVTARLSEVKGARISGGRSIIAGSAGRELILEEGTALTIVLEQPIDIKVRL